MIQKIKLLVALLIFGFIGYLLLYQNIINERANLDDEHCIKVNPLIIKRKNLYIESMRAMLVIDDKELYEKVNAQYIDVSNKYIVEEGKWLEKDSKSLSNPLVKMFAIEQGYETAVISHRMNEIDYINTKYILRMFKEKNEVKRNAMGNEIDINVRELKDLNKDYDRAIESSPKEYRWVDYLIRIPPSSCPVENYNIPDVESELKKMF